MWQKNSSKDNFEQISQYLCLYSAYIWLLFVLHFIYLKFQISVKDFQEKFKSYVKIVCKSDLKYSQTCTINITTCLTCLCVCVKTVL